MKVLSPRLDLSPMDMFKVVLNGQIVEEIAGMLLSQLLGRQENKIPPIPLQMKGYLCPRRLPL